MVYIIGIVQSSSQTSPLSFTLLRATASKEKVKEMATQAPPPVTLQEGYIQFCSGYMERKSSLLKRWKKRWVAIEPGKHLQLYIFEWLKLCELVKNKV